MASQVRDYHIGYLLRDPKKKPLDALGAAPIIGTMAEDSGQRAEMYFRYGCNAFDLKRPRSAPISFWTEADVWCYIHTQKLAYSQIYDMGYTRTGCMFCMFGLHLEGHPNRFERMATTHPSLFRYCMDGPPGLRTVVKTVYRMDLPAGVKK